MILGATLHSLENGLFQILNSDNYLINLVYQIVDFFDGANPIQWDLLFTYFRP